MLVQPHRLVSRDGSALYQHSRFFPAMNEVMRRVELLLAKDYNDKPIRFLDYKILILIIIIFYIKFYLFLI